MDGWEAIFEGLDEGSRSGLDVEWVVKSVITTSRKIEFVFNEHRQPTPAKESDNRGFIDDEQEAKGDLETVAKWIIRRAEEAEGGEILLSGLGITWKRHEASSLRLPPLAGREKGFRARFAKLLYPASH